MRSGAKRFIYPFFLLAGLFFLETALNRVFGSDAVRYFVPQLVFLFVIVVAVWRDLREALGWSFVAGFMGEWFSALYFGTVIFLCLIAVMITYVITRKVASQDVSFSTATAIVGLAAVLLPVGAWGFNVFVSGFGLVTSLPFSDYFSWRLVFRLGANFLFFLFINRIFIRLFDEQT